jgi:hypothetical protein
MKVNYFNTTYKLAAYDPLIITINTILSAHLIRNKSAPDC